jgi:hypothetical protein
VRPESRARPRRTRRPDRRSLRRVTLGRGAAAARLPGLGLDRDRPGHAAEATLRAAARRPTRPRPST